MHWWRSSRLLMAMDSRELNPSSDLLTGDRRLLIDWPARKESSPADGRRRSERQDSRPRPCQRRYWISICPR